MGSGDLSKLLIGSTALLMLGCSGSSRLITKVNDQGVINVREVGVDEKIIDFITASPFTYDPGRDYLFLDSIIYKEFYLSEKITYYDPNPVLPKRDKSKSRKRGEIAPRYYKVVESQNSVMKLSGFFVNKQGQSFLALLNESIPVDFSAVNKNDSHSSGTYHDLFRKTLEHYDPKGNKLVFCFEVEPRDGNTVFDIVRLAYVWDNVRKAYVMKGK